MDWIIQTGLFCLEMSCTMIGGESFSCWVPSLYVAALQGYQNSSSALKCLLWCYFLTTVNQRSTTMCQKLNRHESRLQDGRHLKHIKLFAPNDEKHPLILEHI